MINNLTKNQISQYLRRINFQGDLIPSLELLGSLQKLHLLKIPFENLDIHYGNTIILDIYNIFNKVVINRRGGFCYELNGLFYALLNSLGFDVKMISARVYNGNDYGPEYDHLAIMTKLDGQEYLTDVGFGEFTFHPIEFTLEKIHSDERGMFVLDKYKDNYLCVSKIEDQNKIPKYIFRNERREFEEFNDMCVYHQTSPNSHFTTDKRITLPFADGRVTLTSGKLKLSNNGKVVEIEINDETHFLNKLNEYFGINI